jgi:glyoxylase-like metal-dependent hydrolase (beta-lactamase superfamily II)
VLAPGLSYTDLNFLGVPRVIATGVLQGPDGIALVDPGPSTTLPALEAALGRIGAGVGDVTALLLTHIHLDHAGASGTLVARNPRIRVFVHERGAPHLIDPSKLLASATRLYAGEMDRLWGEFRSLPAAAVHGLSGGETIDAGGRRIRVAYTPGHASHHVSYFVEGAGLAFVGDTAGIRLQPEGYVLPPTPPPDIDLEAWRGSLARIREWRPETLFLTHFGPSDAPAAHLAALEDHLEVAAGLARDSLAREGTDEDREAWFTEAIRRELRRRMGEGDVHAYEVAGRFDLSWRGLARYWRKR